VLLRAASRFGVGPVEAASHPDSRITDEDCKRGEGRWFWAGRLTARADRFVLDAIRRGGRKCKAGLERGVGVSVGRD
jgi:hypothetical protein